MIIGIDIRDLKIAKTGTKTYLEEVCRAFKDLGDPELQFVFLDTNIPIWPGNSKIGKYIEHFRYQVWKQLILPFKALFNKCDMLFCTDNFVPILRLGYQTVPVFHDAFFFENPEHYGKLWLRLYHLTAMPAAKRSAFIVTPSEYAKQQIHKYTNISLKQLTVIPEGPKTMGQTADNRILSQFSLQNNNYILHVGSMFKRKNIPALILAFQQLKNQTNSTVKLVLAGSSTASKDSNDYDLIVQTIESTGLQQDIILTGYLSDSELSGIYENALMYVFPSVNEGFGIPVLEAFDYDLPVLVANNTCLPEVGGDAVLTFNPFDPADICRKMEMVLSDEILRTEMIRKGQIRRQQFSWKKSALALATLFKKYRKHQ